MEQIKLTQTQALSSASSIAGESADDPASTPVAIDDRVIADKVLGVWRGHRKGVGHIVEGKRKMPKTSYLTLASGLSQSQCRLVERVYAQQRDIEA